MEENRVITKQIENADTLNASVKISELCFLAYWSLMLFAKAIGWYDGQTVYKVILVVSIAFWAVKMVLTKYSVLEYTVILVLLGLGAVITLVSGEKGLIICMMTMLGVKNLDIKRILKVGIVVWGGTFGAKFIYNLLFLQNVQTTIQPKAIIGRVNRYYMGYSHPNVLHISFLMMMTLLICYWGKKIDLRKALVLFGLNILIFLYSFSFTGFAITALLIILAFLFRDRELKTYQKVIASLVFPAVLIFSIVLPVVLEGKLLETADKILNKRIGYAKSYLQPQFMSLLGNNLAEITDRYNTMDNSFVFSLVIYGIPVFAAICVLYVFTVHKLIKQQLNAELVTVLCLILGGVSEPYFLNTSFKNISLLYVGMYLFLAFQERGFREFSLLSNLDRDIEAKNLLARMKKAFQSITLNRVFIVIECIFYVLVILLSVFLTVENEIGKFREVDRDFSNFFDGCRGLLTGFLIVFSNIMLLKKAWSSFRNADG